MRLKTTSLSILLATSSLCAMTTEDLYGDKIFIPELYSYKAVPNVFLVKDAAPSIDNVSAVPMKKSYFLIEILKYTNQDLKNKSLLLDQRWRNYPDDQVILNAILDNPDQIVISQIEPYSHKRDSHKTVFIPVEQAEEDQSIFLPNNTNLLALALIAGHRHFGSSQATIKIDNHNFDIWLKLFNEYHHSFVESQEGSTTATRRSFSLNFSSGSIQHIVALAAALHPTINTKETIQTILQEPDGPEAQHKRLNDFLQTRAFEKKEESQTKKPSDNVAFRPTIYRVKLNTIRSFFYQNVIRPIKEWYTYFYNSYRFWKDILT